MTGYTITLWSEFSRKGREYAARIADGERFAIWHSGRIIATVHPVTEGQTVTVTVGIEGGNK